jgi:hydrogenase expression/formation protein HypE
LKDQFITLSHGGGGRASQSLIESVFMDALRNPHLERRGDSAVLEMAGARLAFTTDSYTVEPLFFPGGDIGSLAVNGTVNDLCAAGAEPLYLSLAVILEEGFPLADLRRITASIAHASREAGVQIVTGDTKVVPRGKADRIYINTSGLGLLPAGPAPAPDCARAGDRVLISGPIGDHGATIMAQRGDLGLELDLRSDTAALSGLTRDLMAACTVHCLRDPTRGGLASALNEIAAASQVGIELDENSIPVAPGVRGVCEILGLDPLCLACEGRLLIILPAVHSHRALAALRNHPAGANATEIGRVVENGSGLVLIRTAMGGRRVLDMTIGEALPRIC